MIKCILILILFIIGASEWPEQEPKPSMERLCEKYPNIEQCPPKKIIKEGYGL